MATIDDEDRWLRSALQAAPMPACRDLAPVVRRRLRRANVARTMTVTMILFAAGAVGWWAFQRETPTAVPREIAFSREEARALAALFTPPPVESFDVLNQQQAAYAESLQHLAQETH
ncbi:MAG: hypothetical protein SGJ19_16450 [Planctomycetia bacterium]|nr:hypothetical protein [Planctomycetia bacterium]